MSEASLPNKSSSSEKATPLYANIVSTLAIVLSTGSLILQYPKILRPVQSPVGISHEVGELLPATEKSPAFRYDVITLSNQSVAPLENVVVAVKSPGGLEAKYRLGTIEIGVSKRVCLTQTRELESAQLPRYPFELGVGDTIGVTCNGFLEREFQAKDLGKTELLKPQFKMPSFADIDYRIAKKFNGLEVFCFVYVDVIERSGENIIVQDLGAESVGDKRLVVLPKGTTAVEKELLFVRGVLHLTDAPPDPTNPYSFGSTQYKIVAKEVRRL